ncbi:uncharacterized protein [Parasteatoda tepidariorum]|uniref:uncharacterized protein n=1 Tax=Parasteatoda tepidariorum TaxID=114398 RepID=UPI00077FA6D1|nr:uncharacterized protein LOC107454927 [Parasteatoda tepidariorum]
MMDRFIEQVKYHPCLWDMGDPAYKDFEVMEKAWAEVAAVTNYADGKAAKVQWKKLRDNFREALKRQKDSKGSRAWRYHQHMEFLIPFMQSKNGDLIYENDKASDTTAEILPYSEDANYVINLEEEASDSSSSLPRKKRKNCTPLSYLDDAKRIEMDELNQNLLSAGRNPLLEFFNSMYSTTETLPAHLQLQVKKKVFEIVTEAEETALMLQDQYEKQNKEYDVKDFL